MAQSPYYSPSPSPGVESSHVSDSSSDDEIQSAAYEGAEISRPASPLPAEGQFPVTEGDDTMACQWEDCGKVFDHLPSLIDHIHNGEESSIVVRAYRNFCTRSYWCAQVQLYLRMEDLCPQGNSPNVALRTYLAYTLAYRREAIYLHSPRSVSCFIE